MAKKNAPVWQMLGQPEPPMERDYWTYGTVFTVGQEPGRWTNIKQDLYWGFWSYHYWSLKVRKAFRFILKETFTLPRRA
jgi:hypothetical protein